MAWSEEQDWEANWWGDCTNTYNEERKQQTYAQKMGIIADWDYGHYPVYDLKGISVLDIGGGPVSMLLKCKNFKESAVVDPCDYPKWVDERYKIKEIDYFRIKGEDIRSTDFDEVWIYNVLQHTDSPEKILQNARRASKIIRIFEWIDAGTSHGHPHNLTETNLNKWLGGEGKVEQLNENGCVGKAYYGIFKGDSYV